MLKVLIVEDQDITCQLFKNIINDSGIYQVVRTVSSADFAFMYCEKEDIDLVLMDVCTALDASGLDAAERIIKHLPNVKVIIITSMPEFSWIKRAKDIGVNSFWYKDVTNQSLVDVMNRTVAGEKVYPETTPEVKLGKAMNHDLSERELQVLRELLSGDTNAEIASRLGITAVTVRDHIKVLMEKTGFKTRTELAVEAARSGIVVRLKALE